MITPHDVAAPKVTALPAPPTYTQMTKKTPSVASRVQGVHSFKQFGHAPESAMAETLGSNLYNIYNKTQASERNAPNSHSTTSAGSIFHGTTGP